MNYRPNRRRFLVGAGTMLALPSLEATARRTPLAYGTPPPARQRFMTFHFPMGVHRASWKPIGTENDWTLGESQTPLLAHKNDICIITNVGNTGRGADNGIHTSNAATFLTAADVPRSLRKLDSSADQIIAAHLAGKTRFRSLELGTAILKENPNDEPGFEAVLKDHLSWANGTPLPKEINPARLFDRLFGGTAGPETAQARRAFQKSVLDAVRDDAKRLQQRVSKADNVKLDEYYTGLRALEERIDATAVSCTPGARPGPPADVRDRVTQMLELSVLAFRCDLTRVITFGYEHTVSSITHPWIDVRDTFHIGVTHNEPGPKYAAINKWIVGQLAELLTKLKATDDGDGKNLLDNTIVYFASEMGEGSSHSPDDIPMIVCGRGAGKIAPGRLLDRPGKGNGNVLISLMHAMGANVSSFGNGFTSPLPGLVGT